MEETTAAATATVVATATMMTTVKEIHRKMRVVKGLRWLVKRVIADCVKCRLLEKNL